jgi:hypothetical protein
MTDERLSRRARRAQEEDALSGEIPTTASVPEAKPDTQSLSRRDRRRLERVAHPVETWTAEEEMIATGQIPTVTPEVIAEQERIAREKAAQAQAEAEAASAELRRVSLTETSTQRAAEVMGASPSGDISPEPDAAPLAASSPGAADSAATPWVEDPAPPSLQNLFPPGSLQARAFAESQARAAQETSAGAPSLQASVDNASSAQSGSTSPVSDEGAEEIRRLAAAAMATIESAAPVPTPSAIPAVDDSISATSPAPTTAASTPEPAGDRYAMPALAEPEPDASLPRTAPSLSDVFGIENAPPAAQPAPTPAPESAFQSFELPFERVGTGATPVITPGTGATPMVGAGAWASHPLDAAQPSGPPVDVNAYAPVTNVPQPDFSAVINPATPNTFSPLGPNPASGATPLVPGVVTGSNPLVPPGSGLPPTTGTIPVRRVPELQPAGGARHFRWAHYLVLFALMFIVGVVVFQVIRLNS